MHGILDYLTVLFLLLSPTLFEMQTTGSVFTYVLAIVHLLLTLATDFRPGIFKVIPLKIHGLIELIVSVLLIGVAIWFRVAGDTVSFSFYLIFSVILIVVWTLSDYRTSVKAVS